MPEFLSLTPNLIEEALEIAKTGKGPGLVLDVDETTMNSAPKYVRTLQRLLRRSGIKKEELPTYEDVIEAGSVEAAFGNFDKSVIEKTMELIRNHSVSVRNLPLMHNNIPTILKAAEQAGYPTIMYLSTRPEIFTDLTMIDLVNSNLPKAPLILRPTSIDRLKTTDWKMAQLQFLADKSPHGIIMVDDSRALSNAINQLGSVNLHSILMQGPITGKHEKNGILWDQFISHLEVNFNEAD